jgi:hypothetical protein
MAQDKSKVYRVIEAFSFDHGGRPYSMRIGDLIGTDHPAFSEKRLNMLEEVSSGSGMADYAEMAERAVEVATAAPGERRSVRPARGA